MDQSTLARLKSVIAEQLDVELEFVTETASFVDDLGADSLDLVNLIMTLEEAFDLELPASTAKQIRTVADAISFINTSTSSS